MLSRQTLGTVALASLAAAAASFAIVDQSTSSSRSCATAAVACAQQPVPVLAVVFAVVGAVTLVAGLIPGIWWLVLTIQNAHAADDHADDPEESAERHRRALGDDAPRPDL